MASQTSPAYAALVLYAAVTLAVLYLHSVIKWRRRARGLPFPPGPQPLPLVGNMFSVPTVKVWEGYRALAAKYGDVVHLRVLGRSTLVLGSADAIFEFLDKHSATTSSRTQTPLTELTGQGSNLIFMPYGPRWRRFRRAFVQHFSAGALPRYQPTQLAATHALLQRLLAEPGRARAHVKRLFAEVAMKIVYDIDVAEEDDVYVRMSEEAIAASSTALVPGRFALEVIPWLRYAPGWFPGSGRQKVFAECQGLFKALEDKAYAHVKCAVEKDGASPSIVGEMIASFDSSMEKLGLDIEEAEEMARSIGVVSYNAGSDTTNSTLQSALLALSLHPNAMKRAQAELDAVVGADRLPVFSDLDSLVYIHAIVKEALRWHTTLPVSFPHCTTADDELRGYFIPAGTALIANVWACMRDPAAYDNPDEFRPERFLDRDGKMDPAVRDPFDFVFGFGRRVCPGRHFAQATLTIALASVLHVFDVGPPLDAHGVPIAVVPEATDGLLSYLVDDRYVIKPRSVEAEDLVRRLAHAAA